MFFFHGHPVQLFLFTSILLCSFFLANAMNGVLGRDGFGVIGNMVVIATGFISASGSVATMAFPSAILKSAFWSGLLVHSCRCCR